MLGPRAAAAGVAGPPAPPNRAEVAAQRIASPEQTRESRSFARALRWTAGGPAFGALVLTEVAIADDGREANPLMRSRAVRWVVKPAAYVGLVAIAESLAASPSLEAQRWGRRLGWGLILISWADLIWNAKELW